MNLHQDQIEKMTKQLINSGQIIQAGWISLRYVAYPEASEHQLNMLREAFYAGAQHLFASIMTVLDPGNEPTEADMKRMNKIHEELEHFIKEFKLRHMTKPEGNA